MASQHSTTGIRIRHNLPGGYIAFRYGLIWKYNEIFNVKEENCQLGFSEIGLERYGTGKHFFVILRIRIPALYQHKQQ